MQLDPYLMFDGTCEAAFNFYRQCLGGEIVMMSRYGEAPGEGMPGCNPDHIMHARLEFDGRVLMASDNHPDYPYEGIKGCSMSLNVASIGEAERVFNVLSENGKVSMPLQETFWAVRFGMFEDRFGVPWMVNCETSN